MAGFGRLYPVMVVLDHRLSVQECYQKEASSNFLRFETQRLRGFLLNPRPKCYPPEGLAQQRLKKGHPTALGGDSRPSLLPRY